MRNLFIVIGLLLSFAGCADKGNPTQPLSNPVQSGDLVYTLTASNTSLPVGDTLHAIVKVYNSADMPETLVVGPSLFHWSLKTQMGDTVMSGPIVCPLFLRRLGLASHETQAIQEYSINQPLAAPLGPAIAAGSYILQAEVGHESLITMTLLLYLH